MKENLELFFENPWIYLLGLILIGSYFFFKKKFENLADKDDIASITREVELVKKEFNEDLERLKVDLDVLKSNRINLTSEKRKTIYDFWTSINIYDISLDSFLSNKIEKKEDLVIFQVEMKKIYNNFIFQKSILELQIHELLDDDLKIGLIEIERLFIAKQKYIYTTNVERIKFKIKIDKNEEKAHSYKSFIDKKINHISNEFNVKIFDGLGELKTQLILILKKIHE